MSSIEYYGFLLIFAAGLYFALHYALRASRKVGSADTARRSNALLEAVGRRDVEAVRKLLAGTVEIDARDERGDTALLIAVRNNDLEIAKLLLARDAEVFAADRRGRNAWELAAELNAADGTVGFYARMLRQIETARDVPVRLLLAACRSGDLELAEHALELGASVDSRDYFVEGRARHKGATALMVAVEHDRLEIVRLLVREGADIHFACGWEDAPDTALQLALALDRLAIIEFLLAQSSRQRAVTSGYGAERRVEKQLESLVATLPIQHPAPPGARRNLRQIIADVQGNGCAEILLAPGTRNQGRLQVLLGAVRVEAPTGARLRSRWLEIQRVAEVEFVCSEFETLGPAVA